MKKIIITICLFISIILLVACFSGTKINVSIKDTNKAYANSNNEDLADYYLSKSQDIGYSYGSAYGIISIAASMRQLVDEEKKQTELLQKLVDKK